MAKGWFTFVRKADHIIYIYIYIYIHTHDKIV